MLGVALLMASCTEDFKDWAGLQTNPQEDAKTVVVTVGTVDGTIDLATAGDTSQVFIPNVQVNDEATTTYNVLMVNEDATAEYTMAADAQGFVKSEELQNAVVTLYNPNPKMERTLKMTITSYTVINGMTMKYVSYADVKVRPAAPVIEQAYYYVGATNGWSDSDKSYKFDNGGGDVYENPVFTATVPAPYNEDGSRADNWFKIAPESAYTSGAFWDNLVGVETDGDQSKEGKLVMGGNALCQPAADGATMYRISINMLELTYTITPITFKVEPAYYYVGATTGWSDSDKTYKFTNGGADPLENPVYTCVVPAPYNEDGSRADNWFKIAPESAYTSGSFWDNLFGVETDGDTSTSGNLAFGNVGAFKQPATDNAKFYRISINPKEMTYEITPLSFAEFFYEIGNESGWSTSHPLYGANGDGKYQGFYYLDGEYKFKPNADNWNDDLEYVSGDTMSGTLTSGGGPNCPDPGAGFYQINLDAAALSFSLVKITSVSLIGGFNGWGDDLEMTYDKDNGCWTATTDAVSGEFKFRANHDWGINWGGDVNGLTQDGANLSIGAGTHTFKLYLSYNGAHRVVIE